MASGDAPRRRAVFLRHHDEDDPGLVGAALERRGFRVDVSMVDGRSSPPDLDGVDVLGVLGSKWSVNDEDVGAWLATEIDAIREADHRAIPVLGICFGAQALCLALGGTVERAPRTEIGWADLNGASGEGIPSGPWFEYHSDHCLVPDRARTLVRNDVCVQAFRVGPHLGVQFHPELDAAQLSRWLDAGARDQVIEFGLSPAALLAETGDQEAEATARADVLVDGFLERAW